MKAVVAALVLGATGVVCDPWGSVEVGLQGVQLHCSVENLRCNHSAGKPYVKGERRELRIFSVQPCSDLAKRDMFTSMRVCFDLDHRMYQCCQYDAGGQA